jgi:hypothetical protein
MRDVDDACLWLCSPLRFGIFAARFLGNEMEMTFLLAKSTEIVVNHGMRYENKNGEYFFYLLTP